MRLHSRSIYGAGASEYPTPQDCRYTQKGNRLYVHIFSWPFKHIHLKGLAGKVAYAQLLHDASEVRYQEYDPDREATSMTAIIEEGSIALDLPVQRPNVIVPVVEIFLKE